jgi:hypothetical protein
VVYWVSDTFKSKHSLEGTKIIKLPHTTVVDVLLFRHFEKQTKYDSSQLLAPKTSNIIGYNIFLKNMDYIFFSTGGSTILY